MERWTLREAAARTSLSVTTLRRYIRSGRLHAEKRSGRFGPEYFVSDRNLDDAGLAVGEAAEDGQKTALALPQALPLERLMRESVPSDLFRELQMKHEQLLVQYGMVRAAGLRVLDVQSELEARRGQVADLHAEIARLKERFARDSAELRRRARAAELDSEGAKLEVAALREKVRALEMLTRNAVTNETIDRRFAEILDQTRRVEHLESPRSVSTPPWNRGVDDEGPDH